MTLSNVEIVRSFYDAFGRGDRDAALATLAPDIHWLEAENYPYADSNPCRTPEEVAKGVLDRVPVDWEDFRVDIHEFLPAGENKVLTQGRYTGVNRKTGKRIDAQVAHVWIVSDGKLSAFQQYADTLQVVEATRS